MRVAESRGTEAKAGVEAAAARAAMAKMILDIRASYQWLVEHPLRRASKPCPYVRASPAPPTKRARVPISGAYDIGGTGRLPISRPALRNCRFPFRPARPRRR